MRKNVPRTRRSRALLVLAAAAIGALIWVVGAFADAGNPIVGTIKGSLVTNNDGTVTVYVRGQWNWLTHNSDCNADRAGAGAAFIWNDPNEPGYPISGTTASGTKFTALVGVKSKLNGDTLNNIDGTAHPADLGNVPESKSGPAGQSFFDSTTGSDQPAGAAHPYTTWKGGCGRVPLTDTAGGPVGATFPTSEATGLTCAGDGACFGHPWGSWGYFKGSTTDASTTGYSHTYLHRSDVTTVCVDFYDVHGKNQIVGGSKEIDVLGNGDNSIQTNKFDPTQGANCVDFPFIKSTTPVTPVTVGDKIHDSATIGGAAATHKTTLTFHLFNFDDQTCKNASIFDSGPFDETGNATQQSGDFTTTAAGTYQWTVELRDKATGALLDTSKCGDEPSVVNKAGTKTDTAQKLAITDFSQITGTAGVPLSGTVTFALFGPPEESTDAAALSDCLAYDASTNKPTPLALVQKTLSGGTTGSETVDSGPIKVNLNGTYYWNVSYGGDDNNKPSISKCTETSTIAGNVNGVDP